MPRMRLALNSPHSGTYEAQKAELQFSGIMAVGSYHYLLSSRGGIKSL